MLLIVICQMKAISTCHTSDVGICIYTYILTLLWRMGDYAASKSIESRDMGYMIYDVLAK